jgi:DHA2 family multidrug resistance protein
MVANLTTENPVAMDRLAKYTNYFMSNGATNFTAQKQALQIMENVVVKQSSQLSFSDAFLIVGIVFMIALPMLLFTVKKKGEKVRVILSDH